MSSDSLPVTPEPKTGPRISGTSKLLITLDILPRMTT